MFRTLLFIPGNNKKFLDKSKILSPDILCYDLEDSVPNSEKSIAREMIVQTFRNRNRNKNLNSDQEANTFPTNFALDKGSQIFVRINSFESGLYESDLKSVLSKGLDGVVVPKVNSHYELKKIITLIKKFEHDRKLERVKIIPSIESCQGVVNSYSIATIDSRVCALVFGVFDYLYDMKLDYVEKDGLEYSYARAKIPVDARAAGIPALDSIWQRVDDLDGLKKDATVAKRLGYSGKSIIHPKHIEPIHKVFIPSQNEIKWAKEVLSVMNQVKEKGDKRGALKVDGKMVDAVHFKQAQLILDSLQQATK